MYISKISIKNFRSIKKTEFTLIKGKNVIIGKNNSGKSNILKAIDLVLGKYKLISDTDFYLNDKNNVIEIQTEISTDNGEIFKLNDILNKPFVLCYGSNNDITSIDFDPPKTNKTWITGTNETYGTKIDDELNNVKKILIYNKFYVDVNEKVKEEVLLLWEKSDAAPALKYHYTDYNFLISSFIFGKLDSIRKPDDFFKVSDFNWYGKLMKDLVGKFGDEVLPELEIIEAKSLVYFSEKNLEISKISKQGAFQDTSLEFSILPDFTSKLYKQARIEANDGIKSDITEKGSGIQNAVIINLFIYYVEKYLVSVGQSSLFCLEEPEIYLHPHGRRVINNRIEEYLKNDRTQAIITTHSTDFINFADSKINIIKVSKDVVNGTNTSQIEKPDGQILKNKENLEMFFADKVVLCEGADKYVLEKIAEEMGEADENLGKNWLDNNNISIIKVQGKGYFQRYINILDQLKTQWFVFGDLDNITTTNGFIMEYLGAGKPALEAIKTFYSKQKIEDDNKFEEIVSDEKSNDGQSLIFELEKCIEGNEITESFKQLWDYVKPRFIKKLQHFLSNMDKNLQDNLNAILTELKTKNIFILSRGELENYDSNNILGNHKEKKVIEIIENLELSLSNSGFECAEFVEFLNLIKPANNHPRNE